jgi:hypothetical protein
VGDLGFDPETALKLIQILLRVAAYFFAGFAILGLSAYVVFLCLEIFASRPRAKAKTAFVPQPVGCAAAVQQTHGLVSLGTPTIGLKIGIQDPGGLAKASVLRE